MPPKLKNPEEGPTTSQPQSGCCSHSTKDDGSATVPVVKPETKPDPCPLKIQWDSNEHWTDHFIEYLTNHLDVQLKMFSDSIKDAKKESHKKVSPQHNSFGSHSHSPRLLVANPRSSTTVR